MRFDFCGEQFTVSVIDNLIRDGILCDGYFEPGARRVLISTVATDRKRTLFHELRHAWIFALGQRGIDPESDACGSVTVWREVAAEDGTPLGRFLPTPRVLRGSQRAAWLRDQKTLAVH